MAWVKLILKATTTVKKVRGSIAAVLATVVAFSTGVETTWAAFVNYSVSGGGFGGVNVTWDGTTVDTPAGGLVLSKVSGDASMPQTILSVCIDIGGTLILGRSYGYSAPTSFEGQSGFNPTWGAGNQGNLSSSDNAMAAIQAAANIFYAHSSVLSLGSVTEKTALQLAVWEALYDTQAGGTTYGLDGGRFKVNSGNSAALSLASDWLNDVGNTTYAGFLLMPDPMQQYNYTGQEVFFGVTPVPEASTIIAGALLLLPLAASSARILRRSRSVKD